MRAALRKLVRALPEGFRAQAEAASTALVVDPTGWDQAPGRATRSARTSTPLQEAVIDGVQVVLGYTSRDGAATERTVHPLGLASKGAGLVPRGRDRGRAAHVPGRPRHAR